MFFNIFQNILLIRIQNLALIAFRVLPGHYLLIVRVGNELRQVYRDDILELLIHLRDRRIPSRLLLEHVVLTRSLD